MTVTRMRLEIEEQPDAVARTLSALLPLGEEIQRLGRDKRHVLFIARGTSDNAAVYGQYLCSVRGDRLATLASPSVATVYGAELDLNDVLAVGVSQSGDTEEIVETLEWAARCGAATVAVTNGRTSDLAGSSDLALITEAGVERAVPATKTYTTQLAALAVLCYSLSGDTRRRDALRRVPEVMHSALGVADDAARLAGQLTVLETVVVSARGYAFTTARELALKLQEACYVTALGVSYADLVHGPIAVVDTSSTALLIAAREDRPVLSGMTLLAQQCRERGATVYGIGGDEAFAAACHETLPVPDCAGEVAPMPLIVPGQLLAESLARAKGIDPDSPRGLSKVTQTT